MADEREYSFTVEVIRELYYSDATSYGVYSFKTPDEMPELEKQISIGRNIDWGEEHTDTIYNGVLSGRMQRLYEGDKYDVVAKLVFSKKYNKYQYEPIRINSAVLKTAEEQESFLLSILTESQAKTLITAYPNIVEDIMDGKDNVDFDKLQGIGKITYDKIKEKVINNYVISDILSMLQPLGVTLNAIKKLTTYEPNAVLLKKELIENPYILTSIRGFGFKKVDTLAIKLNPELKESDKRLKAFIRWFLTETGEGSGHTWVDKGVLEEEIINNVRECHKYLDECYQENEESDRPFLHIEGRKIGLQKYYDMEYRIIEKLNEISNQNPLSVSEENIRNGIIKAEQEQGYSLTEEQMAIAMDSLNSNAVAICGKAGTGKTSSVRTILNIYKEANCSIACCALSAKAVKVIEESTGFQANTIHRLLGSNGLNKFTYNENNPLPYSVLLIDEGSMNSTEIFYYLLRAVRPTTKIIICGDNRQLPPIGYGNTFNDIVLNNVIKTFTLTKVLRQAEKSGILSDANKIRDGINPIAKPELKIVTGELNDMTYMFRDDRDMLNGIAIKSFMGAVKKYGVDDVLIGVPRKSNCTNCTASLNEKIQDLLLPNETRCIVYGTRKYKLGAKVIQRTNDYEKDVFNGDIGYIIDIFQEKEGNKMVNKFTIEFASGKENKQVVYMQSEIDQIDLAYAMTIHSLQGSGYKAVIIIIDNTHYVLLDNCLLYTALTRAKEKCLLLAEPSAFKKCINTNKTVARQTWTKNILENFKKGIDKE